MVALANPTELGGPRTAWLDWSNGWLKFGRDGRIRGRNVPQAGGRC